MCEANSKRNLGSMKKVAITVFGVLALAASANAQRYSNAYGTWYTSQSDWTTSLTSLGGIIGATATYDTVPTGLVPCIELGVEATSSGAWYQGVPGVLTNTTLDPITFKFTGNAFGGMFGLIDDFDASVQAGLTFSIDGSLTNVQPLTSTTAGSGYTFLGYISNSASNITVKVSGDSSNYVAVDSFSRANGTNPADPGASVAPEPGTLVLALTGGCALIGMYIRRRRMSN